MDTVMDIGTGLFHGMVILGDIHFTDPFGE